MSRIAKMPITVPEGLDVSLAEGWVRIRGPRGELALNLHPVVHVTQGKGFLTCGPKGDGGGAMAQVGTTRSLIANMVEGVSAGFRKELALVGVGYRAQMQGTNVGALIGVLSSD